MLPPHREPFRSLKCQKMHSLRTHQLNFHHRMCSEINNIFPFLPPNGAHEHVHSIYDLMVFSRLKFSTFSKYLIIVCNAWFIIILVIYKRNPHLKAICYEHILKLQTRNRDLNP
mgnify:FL=1